MEFRIWDASKILKTERWSIVFLHTFKNLSCQKFSIKSNWLGKSGNNNNLLRNVLFNNIEDSSQQTTDKRIQSHYRFDQKNYVKQSK